MITRVATQMADYWTDQQIDESKLKNDWENTEEPEEIFLFNKYKLIRLDECEDPPFPIDKEITLG